VTKVERMERSGRRTGCASACGTRALVAGGAHAADFRAVLPGGQLDDAAVMRERAGAGDLPAAGGDDERADRGGEQIGGGIDILVHGGAGARAGGVRQCRAGEHGVAVSAAAAGAAGGGRSGQPGRAGEMLQRRVARWRWRPTARAALELFKPGRSDAVLMDLRLPDWTGRDGEAFPEPGAGGGGGSGADHRADGEHVGEGMAAAKQAGMNDFLAKPISGEADCDTEAAHGGAGQSERAEEDGNAGGNEMTSDK